jgi:hypothetical protein
MDWCEPKPQVKALRQRVRTGVAVYGRAMDARWEANPKVDCLLGQATSRNRRIASLVSVVAAALIRRDLQLMVMTRGTSRTAIESNEMHVLTRLQEWVNAPGSVTSVLRKRPSFPIACGLLEGRESSSTASCPRLALRGVFSGGRRSRMRLGGSSLDRWGVA